MSNRIEKIKNYNQIILALAGTIGIVILLFAAIMMLIEISNNMSYDYNDRENGIIASEETKQLTRDSIRKQIISFSRMEVIDSVNQIFLLPVTQANLDEDEYYDQGVLNLFGSSKERTSMNINSYNNLVICNAISGTSEIVFRDRLSIQSYFVFHQNEKKYLIITGTNNDSNKDGLFNIDDMQELFIYNFENKEVAKIEAEKNYTILRVFQPEKFNHLVAYFGVDRNNNNDFDRSTEPRVYYTIDLNTMTLNQLVNSDQLNVLQKLLEGR